MNTQIFYFFLTFHGYLITFFVFIITSFICIYILYFNAGILQHSIICNSKCLISFITPFLIHSSETVYHIKVLIHPFFLIWLFSELALLRIFFFFRSTILCLSIYSLHNCRYAPVCHYLQFHIFNILHHFFPGELNWKSVNNISCICVFFKASKIYCFISRRSNLPKKKTLVS